MATAVMRRLRSIGIYQKPMQTIRCRVAGVGRG